MAFEKLRKMGNSIKEAFKGSGYKDYTKKEPRKLEDFKSGLDIAGEYGTSFDKARFEKASKGAVEPDKSKLEKFSSDLKIADEYGTTLDKARFSKYQKSEQAVSQVNAAQEELQAENREMSNEVEALKAEVEKLQKQLQEIKSLQQQAAKEQVYHAPQGRKKSKDISMNDFYGTYSDSGSTGDVGDVFNEAVRVMEENKKFDEEIKRKEREYDQKEVQVARAEKLESRDKDLVALAEFFVTVGNTDKTLIATLKSGELTPKIIRKCLSEVQDIRNAMPGLRGEAVKILNKGEEALQEELKESLGLVNVKTKTKPKLQETSKAVKVLKPKRYSDEEDRQESRLAA